jgi:hypothetical protein
VQADADIREHQFLAQFVAGSDSTACPGGSVKAMLLLLQASTPFIDLIGSPPGRASAPSSDNEEYF